MKQREYDGEKMKEDGRSPSGVRVFMRAGVARRIARRLEEDSVSPQVGRKHVRYRDQGELHVGWSSPKD